MCKYKIRFSIEVRDQIFVMDYFSLANMCEEILEKI